MNIFFNEKEQRPRAAWRVLLQFVMMIVFTGLGVTGFQYLFSRSPMLFSTFAQFLGITLSVWIAGRYLDKRSFFDFGIKFDREWGYEFIIGSVIAALAVGVIFLIEFLAGWISITGTFSIQGSGSSFYTIFLSSLLAMLMVGFHEELFSRGYQILNIVEGLRNHFGIYGAIGTAVLLTSSLFGFMHVFNPNASAISTFNIILAGAVLALPYILTGRLALSVGLHFSWNFTMGGILGFPVSGQHFGASLLKLQQNGSELWTGGNFGPEAGLVGLVGMAIMAGGVFVYLKTKGNEAGIAQKFK